MARPLIISDCDGVLLEFARPFTEYLHQVHSLTLKLESFALSGNIRNSAGDLVPAADFPGLLDGFFSTHMPHQPPVPGAVHALATLALTCDVVILTNIADHHAQVRTHELAQRGMPYRVIGNKGPKGGPIKALLDQFQPSTAVFIDDLPPHHTSAAQLTPHVHRLHMVAEHELRHLIPEASDAHARIDDWADALPHIQSILGARP